MHNLKLTLNSEKIQFEAVFAAVRLTPSPTLPEPHADPPFDPGPYK